MVVKKVVSLSKLTFAELKDKAKEIEGASAMNRFEMTAAIRQAGGQKLCPEVEKANPRNIKPEIAALKARLASTPGADKKARKELRQALTNMKRNTRKYL